MERLMLNENSIALISWVNYLQNAYHRLNNLRVCYTGMNPLDNNQLDLLIRTIGGDRASELYKFPWEICYRVQQHALQGKIDKVMFSLIESASQFVNSLKIVIVGREEFDTGFLTYLLPFACRNPDLIVISQEDFLNHINDIDSWIPYHRNDVRVRSHPGLKFLSDIGFEWPEVEWRQPKGTNSSFVQSWNTESKLKKQFGYSAAQNVSIEERRRALANAVLVMGLEEVASFLVEFLIQKFQNTPSHQEAIEKRLEDSEWLKRTFYDQSIHQFVWPRP